MMHTIKTRQSSKCVLNRPTIHYYRSLSAFSPVVQYERKFFVPREVNVLNISSLYLNQTAI
jgi:hypothetical protein